MNKKNGKEKAHEQKGGLNSSSSESSTSYPTHHVNEHLIYTPRPT